MEGKRPQRELGILGHKNFVFPIDLEFARLSAKAGLAQRLNWLEGC